MTANLNVKGVRYFINVDSEFVGTLKKPRMIRKIDRRYDSFILYSTPKLSYIRISHTIFKDSRETGRDYYFYTKPGVSLFRLYMIYSKIYKEKSKEEGAPDPLFGGSINEYNSAYKELLKDNTEYYVEFLLAVALQMFNSYVWRKPIKINPISLRILWSIERVAHSKGFVFSYFMSRSGDDVPENFDIILVPFEKNGQFLNWIIGNLRENIDNLYYILSIDGKEKDKKLGFLTEYIRKIISLDVYDKIYQNLSHITRNEVI